MQQYLELVSEVLHNGITVSDRTGIGTRSLFGKQIRFDLEKGFPICTTKFVPFKSVLSELLWFISGSDNLHDLRALLHGEQNRFNDDMKTIWDDNYNTQGKAMGYKFGHVGPIYGVQWRRFNNNKTLGDQLSIVIDQIKNNPNSRRIVLTTWNPLELHKMILPPCHILAQFKVVNNKLNCMVTMRSVDLFLGMPFDIASYAILTNLIARICKLDLGELIMSTGDTHIYLNHIEQVKEMLSREPKPLPLLMINNKYNIEDYTMDDFELINYEYHPAIKAPMAV